MAARAEKFNDERKQEQQAREFDHRFTSGVAPLRSHAGLDAGLVAGQGDEIRPMVRVGKNMVGFSRI